MILNPSDPSGEGLFSRCGRNHASKTKPHYRPSSVPLKPKERNPDRLKKKPQSHFGFDKQMSR